MGYTEIFRGPRDNGIYAVGVGQSLRAHASKLDLVSGKSLLENCDDSIQMKGAQTFSVFETVPKAEQHDWKKRKKN